MEDTKTFCIYHSADLDGKCSAAIFSRRFKFQPFELIPMDYGEDVPLNWMLVGSEGFDKLNLYLLDFSFDDDSEFFRITKYFDKVFLIDHHKTTDSLVQEFSNTGSLIEYPYRIDKENNVKYYYTNDNKYILILDNNDFAACELVWTYLNDLPYSYTPLAVQMLGRYDCWDHYSISDTLEFQMGMRSEENFPHSRIWDKLLEPEEREEINNIVKKGSVILEYSQKINKEKVDKCSFETKIFGYDAVACNSIDGNSKMFEHLDKNIYPVWIKFYMNSRRKFYVSLYTERDDIDVSEIARFFGGGGHSKAAGFVCENLPF